MSLTPNYPIVLFPDVEELVISFLTEQLQTRGYPGLAVATQRPRNQNAAAGKAPWVRVRSVGGARRTVVTTDASVAVEAYASDEAAASALAALIRALMPAMDAVMSVTEMGAPSNLPDDDTEQSRYTATYIIRVRGYAAPNQ